MSTTTSSGPLPTQTDAGTGSAQATEGISLVAFLTALATSLVVFAIQMIAFLLLRNKLARIFKPKTFLVPERERTEPPPSSPWGLVFALMKFKDREIIKKCGLDAYFFLRYLQTLLIIFVPIAFIVIPILIPINFVGGRGRSVLSNTTDSKGDVQVTGLDTLAWGNVAPQHQGRRWAHLILALGVIVWVCYVFFYELRVYIKVRQDYLTSAEHRLRASANTVLVSSIPGKWYTEDALRGLFDVFPGGIRNIWLTRDFTKLLSKIHKRDDVHKKLESAESDLIRAAKKNQLKQRQAEEEKARKQHRLRTMSKAERAQRDKQEDENAKIRAQGPGGISSGDHEEVPHDARAAAHHGDRTGDDAGRGTGDFNDDDQRDPGLVAKVPVIGSGLAKVGFGLKKGVQAVGDIGQGVIGGAKDLTKGIDGELERTGGFEFVNNTDSREAAAASPDRRTAQTSDYDEKPKVSFASESPLHRSETVGTARTRQAVTPSPDSAAPKESAEQPRYFGNTTRKLANIDDMIITDEPRLWQFWKPPSGAYASPIPQGAEDAEYPFDQSEEIKKSFWQKIKKIIPFMGGDEEEHVEYPKASTAEYDDIKEEGAEWERWIKPKDRPTHRLARFDWTPGWLPGLPYLNKKVDTIYWCRSELARLNAEIEEDQQHPERYPTMNSAFIQFNNQVAAHMACQSITHHVPKRMAPRIVEISPEDVLWDNMAIKWWDEWARKLIVFAIVVGMVILWTFPVAFTASISQIDALIRQYPWLGFLQRNSTVYSAVKAVAGVLPAILLAILLALVPIILDQLATFQGSKTGAQKAEVVQVYYFTFLFVTVFLVVSITSSAWSTLSYISKNIVDTPNLLAKSLPKAANYFFSYMILQALSTSSGTLLQIGTLIVWYVLSRMLDNTARSKWRRNTQLNTVNWGSFFPVYTNFACIALIYSVISPLISLFAIITFSLLWVAHRYNMLYVTRFRTDTGGVLYPRAINQTFTGLYVMELCLIGLFSLAKNEAGTNVAIPQAIIMFVAAICTALYQFLLNKSFGPLFRYLPITFEDEAVLRDEAFQRAQERRLGIAPQDDEAATLNNHDGSSLNGDEIEMRKLEQSDRAHTTASSRLQKLNPARGIRTAGTWAARGGKRVHHATIGKADAGLTKATEFRRQKRLRDLEAQRAMGEALYGGYNDEIEDLTPEERDVLVRNAFQHSALRARRPTVWIPRDDIGVSDDEIIRTRQFSDYIWISNEGTALDSKVRVLYGRNPPDFSELDIINL